MIKPKILIVENELIIAKDISNILEDEGYETLIGITTVDEAIKTIQLNEFDLVLIDINLSNNSDGVLLGKYLLNKDTIPFIYITSYSDNVTLERIKDTRPHGIIIKPFKSIDIKTTTSIVLYNFKHKFIDVVRNDEVRLNDEIPFILKKVINYINTNIEEQINIDELAKLTQWSSHYFIRIFTKYMKLTPYQYILKKKVEKSKVLIMESNMPITTIAYALGFSSYSNFYSVFKRETGKTPHFYKKHDKIKKHIGRP